MRLQQSKDVLHLGWAWISGRLGTCTPPVTSEEEKMIGGDRVVTLTSYFMHGNVSYPLLKGMLIGDEGGPYSSVPLKRKVVNSKTVMLPTDSSA